MVSHGATGKKSYSKEMIDFFAIYIFPYDSWYIIPVKILAGKKTAYINILKSEFDEYKEAWNLLEIAS